MKDEYKMDVLARRQALESAVPYSERQLIQRAIKKARPRYGKRGKPRWALVKDLFGTGQTVSTAICTKYGFDPDKDISPLARLSDDDYEENLLQHGVVRFD